MDTPSPCSDPNPPASNSQWTDSSESASASDSFPCQTAFSNGDIVILASNHPKKRSGRKKFKETRHPVYRGIRRRNYNRWVCELREPYNKSRIWLGTYPTAEMAARAHDVAALALRGQLACLNFADSVWRLPVPVSNSAKDIRKAAAEAAEAFRPIVVDELCSESMKASDAVSSSNETVEDEKTTLTEKVAYMDEEAVFDMPGLLAYMAEGLLISPPACLFCDLSSDDVGSDANVSLWSY
uniref:Transcription factor ERF43 n=1 Tax=Nothapodytes nimmoniana TaxID=159386 RepID=A0A9E8Z0B2_NOTNI|nr:transcription factor ERF43 [Nothapodytes nimmoniana]